MLIKLTEEQRNNMLAILKDANIKGAAWRVIAELENALNTNQKEPDKKEPSKDEPTGS